MNEVIETERFLKIAKELEASATIKKENVPIVLEILEEYIRIHRTCTMTEYDKLFDRVEKALGFKLFIWQKTFIATGFFRRFGKTTAEILADLLRANDKPIDFSFYATSHRERFRRNEYRKIQEQLQDAGIPTRKIFWSEREKEKYMRGAALNRHFEEETKQMQKPPIWVYEDLKQEGEE